MDHDHVEVQAFVEYVLVDWAKPYPHHLPDDTVDGGARPAPPTGTGWFSYWPLGAPAPWVEPSGIAHCDFLSVTAVETLLVVRFRWRLDEDQREYVFLADLSGGACRDPLIQSTLLWADIHTITSRDGWRAKAVPISPRVAVVPPPRWRTAPRRVTTDPFACE